MREESIRRSGYWNMSNSKSKYELKKWRYAMYKSKRFSYTYDEVMDEGKSAERMIL